MLDILNNFVVMDKRRKENGSIQNTFVNISNSCNKKICFLLSFTEMLATPVQSLCVCNWNVQSFVQEEVPLRSCSRENPTYFQR